MPRETLTIAHRGASFWEPENSLAALEAALKLEASCIEVDVRRCRDGLLTFHDATLDRTTDGRGSLAELSLREVKQLYLGVGQRIPTLHETLRAVRGKARLLVEIKEPETGGGVLETVRGEGLLAETLFVSFHHSTLLELKKASPEIETGIIFRGELLTPVEAAKRVKADWILPDYRHTTPRMVEQAHNEGLKVGVWVVNSRDEVERMKKLEVDAIASDRPEILTGKALHRPPRAYIAGPIQGLEDRQEYRESLRDVLSSCGFQPVDPWLREQAYYQGTNREEAYRLTRRDLLDLQYCEVLVAYLPVASAGVAMEIYHAKTRGKKVYLVSPVENLSPWLLAHTDKNFKNFEELEVFLKNLGSSTF